MTRIRSEADYHGLVTVLFCGDLTNVSHALARMFYTHLYMIDKRIIIESVGLYMHALAVINEKLY